MMILSRAKRFAYLGVFTALAMIFSYLEFLLPLPFALPGFKLGLCNVVVLFVAYRMGLWEGAALSFVRVTLASLLFGTVTSFLFSLFGAFFAYLAILFSKLVLKDRLSFIGVSALSAAAFNCGQIVAACTLYKTLAPLGYLPVLLFVSAVFGGFVGWLLNLLSRRLAFIG